MIKNEGSCHFKRRKFCSRSHAFKYFKKHKISAFFDPKIKSENGKIGGKKAVRIQRKNKTGLFGISYEQHSQVSKNNMRIAKKNKTGFFDPSHRIQKMGSKIGYKISHKMQRLNGIGFWNSKVQSELGRRGNISNKKNKTGFWDPKVHKKSLQSQKENKTGFFDPKNARKNGKIGGPIGGAMTAEILRNNYGYSFKRVKYFSMAEREFAVNIYYQIGKLIVGKNYQVKIGSKTFDFFINNTFIEYHPHIPGWYNKYSPKQYYNQRRQILDENGYENYSLIVIR